MHDRAADARRIGALELPGDRDLASEVFRWPIDRFHVGFAANFHVHVCVPLKIES
jgi:hypothetical protein